MSCEKGGRMSNIIIGFIFLILGLISIVMGIDSRIPKPIKGHQYLNIKTGDKVAVYTLGGFEINNKPVKILTYIPKED